MSPVRAVIFDMDGVLVDSERLHIDAWHVLFAQKGISVSEETFRNAIGQSDLSFLEELFAARGLRDEVIPWLLEKKVIFDRILRERGRLFPGARELVAALQGKYRLAVASSSWRGSVQIALETLGLIELFDDFVGKDDVTRHKPDPEVYLLAARRLDALPAECVAIEDSLYGIDAALAAGMRCIGVAHSLPAGRIRRADLVVDSLRDKEAILAFLNHSS